MTKTTTAKSFTDSKEAVENTIKAAQVNVQKAVETAKVNVQKAVETAQVNVQKAVKSTQENVDKVVKSTQVNAEKAVKEASNKIGKVTEFNKANYESLVESSKAAAKVAQTLNAEFLETSKKAVEKSMADMKSLFSVKSPAEFFELQATIFKNRYDEIVSESTRAKDVATTATTEVLKPLKSRYEEVVKQYNLPVSGK